jgi:hypothetical protein
LSYQKFGWMSRGLRYTPCVVLSLVEATLTNLEATLRDVDGIISLEIPISRYCISWADSHTTMRFVVTLLFRPAHEVHLLMWSLFRTSPYVGFGSDNEVHFVVGGLR